ncbi:acyl-CoA dehydrogenase [Saccharopolyspora rhizosphaerae]|uniref:Acyl-CoA dehydrogenase n=1 Tax=Saccharopolyspora rhizosphaerae TaxID=2492662 RepID=A0A3R8QE35_9PSEU|nr:acyl-CoA dehydrogenase family protein [Saccharopolyspora rhizosphaerae]RRO18881.1 acyl-CoA dehydrogenase [Saccharopolyspora rhizosphaerae]
MGGLHVSGEFDALIERIRAIGPVLEDNADHSEELGRLNDETADALTSTGVLRMGVPADLGGYELSPIQAMRAIAEVSYHDASAGWVVMALQLATGTTPAYLGHDVVDDLYPDVRSGHHAVIAGQGTKPGAAVRVEGGHRISGDWQFASGVSMATHIHTAAFCADEGRGLVFTLPIEQVVLEDNWDVMGLRATGSNDYSIRDVFVPASYTYEATCLEPRIGGALYRLGLANMGICHTGWALGVGRRMLDEMRALAARKTGAPGAGVDTQQFHAEYARAEAQHRAARAFSFETWRDCEDTLDSGSPLSTEQETLTRLVLNHTTSSVHEVGQTVYRWAGTAALRRGVLQRFFRDLHGGTQHVTSSPGVLQSCGKLLSGLSSGRWAFLSLVEQG